MWASNVHFKGRYRNGSDKGDWSMTHFTVPSGWANDHNHAYDMAAAVSGRNIQTKIGSAGWIANFAVNQGSYDAVGYPAEAITGYAFDGKYMWHSQGSFVSGNTSNIEMCNNMTQGCSGGPWSVLVSGKHRMNGLQQLPHQRSRRHVLAVLRQ
jgi:hypothetical protein